MMDTTTIFPSPRNDRFPTGLRVLVVDDDLTWLKILEKMLKKCFYEVTTCCLARDALRILRDRKDGFDIVISDVNMPDMDGFKLLELLGLEMDLPVIMMSVDGETSRVMKGVQHGACDYLLKPIRMKELRNIWQHVLRKRINDVQSFDEVIRMMRIGNDHHQQQHQTVSDHVDLNATRKRKNVADKIHSCSTELSDRDHSKRARVVWTVDLHQKFVKAVKLIGIEKIGPKKILDSMNVPWLTRENVASHLQKYRLYLSRLQKDNNGDKPFEVSDHLDVDFCKLKHPDILTIDDLARHSESVQSNSRFADPDFNVLSKYSWNEDISIEHNYFENVGEQNERIDYGFSHWPLHPPPSSRSIVAGTSRLDVQEVIENYENIFEAGDSELALVAFGKDYKIRWNGQRDRGSDNFHGRDEADLMAAVPVHLFDALRFAPSCPTMMDQSVSIVDTANFTSSYYQVS